MIGFKSKGAVRLTLLALGSSVAVSCLNFLSPWTGGEGLRAAQDPRSKQIVLGMVWEPVSFNPIRGIDSGSYVASSLVYESLVKYDGNMQLGPALAESYEAAADGLSIHFLLRPNLRFSNGEKLTAADVKASLSIGASDLSPFKSDYADIKEVAIGSDREFTIKLSRPCQPLISRLAELRILPLSLLKLPDHGNQTLSREPIGTGPYRLVRWESGLELVFERNPYYWGRPAATEKIVWRVVPDRNVLAVALARGEVDIAPIDGRIWAALAQRSQDPAGGGKCNGGRSGMTPLKVAEFNGNRTVYLGFNMQREPWKQLLVRRALAQAINRQALARVFYGGYAVLPDSDVPITSWAFSKDTRALKFDLKEAQELLQQAGYMRRGGHWYKDPADTCPPLALRIHTIKEQEEIAQAVADYLGKLGVEAEVAVMEYSTLRRSCLKPGKFDAILWSRSYGPDPECSVVWSSKGPLNFCKLQVPEVDCLITLGRSARSREERAMAYGKLQKYLSEELPWVFLAQPKQLLAYKEGLKGVQKGQQQSVGLPWDNPVFNAADWQF